MRTDDLIARLADDLSPSRVTPGRRLAPALAAGIAVSAAVFLVWFGFRADFAQSLADPRVLLKFAVTLGVAISALGLAVRLTSPGAKSGGWGRALLWPVLLLAVGVAAELALTDPSAWGAAALGSNAVRCLTMVPLLAAAPLAAILIVLRQGAPTRPALAGAVAGLAAAGIAAAIYAAYCADDSPLFVAVWYSLAIGLVAVLGGALGARLLRW